MSINDTLTIIISILVPMLAAFWTILHKMDNKFEKMEQKFEQRFAKVDNELHDIKTRLTILETVMGIISAGSHFNYYKNERTDP
jgi:energy-converting hydrogenase Eha subunit H